MKKEKCVVCGEVKDEFAVETALGFAVMSLARYSLVRDWRSDRFVRECLRIFREKVSCEAAS